MMLEGRADQAFRNDETKKYCWKSSWKSSIDTSGVESLVRTRGNIWIHTRYPKCIVAQHLAAGSCNERRYPYAASERCVSAPHPRLLRDNSRNDPEAEATGLFVGLDDYVSFTQ